MGTAVNKRSVMTLFSDLSGIYSHQIRLVLAEKEITSEIEFIRPEDELPQDLIDLNPYGTLPTLIDRELTLYDPHIILEYLDERFPHPPLMPVYPILRAKSRLMMHRINKEWYSALKTILDNPTSKNADKARIALRDDLIAVSPIFKEYPFFMSNDFSLIDCYMGPLLWRLKSAKIILPTSADKYIASYMNHLFNKETFLASLTDEEKNFI